MRDLFAIVSSSTEYSKGSNFDWKPIVTLAITSTEFFSPVNVFGKLVQWYGDILIWCVSPLSSLWLSQVDCEAHETATKSRKASRESTQNENRTLRKSRFIRVWFFLHIVKDRHTSILEGMFYTSRRHSSYGSFVVIFVNSLSYYYWTSWNFHTPDRHFVSVVVTPFEGLDT